MLPVRLFILLSALFLGACASSPPYVYRYVPGKTAVLRDGIAEPPPDAPPQVLAAIAAGNRIAGFPYRYGGGHRTSIDSAYDCSGAASFVLMGAGALGGPMPSTGFRKYGQKGFGNWISVYARRDHTFLVVAGLRFDTGWGNGSARGPQWATKSRTTSGSVIRHPAGL